MEILFEKSFTLEDLLEYDDLSIVPVLRGLVGFTFAGDEHVCFVRYKDCNGMLVNHVSVYVHLLCSSDFVSLLDLKSCLWSVLPSDNCIELSIYF